MDNDIYDAATRLGEVLMLQGKTVTTAESCTSGWAGAALAAVTDSSRFYSSGFITYTDQAKARVLNVNPDTLERYTAVSEATVREMACGARLLTGDSIGIAISGYAGPDGGEDGTPPGTVWFGWCLEDGCVYTSQQWFAGSSEDVMKKASLFSLSELIRILAD